MRTVGIMSMQRIFNYGSSLQAYALRKIVEEIESKATVSFLDYKPGPVLISPESNATRQQSGQLARSITKLREYNDVKAPLRDKLRFFNHKRTYARRFFPMVGITPEPNRNLNVDLQIIGSDEVFNCVQSNTNVGYTRELFGANSPAKRVISYAGSFGNTTLERIEMANVGSQIAEDLAALAKISVRDRNSASIVETLTGRAPEIHLDPTLVFNFANDARIPKARQRRGKYVIVYGYSGRLGVDENDAIRRYATSIGADVIAFGGLQAVADEFVDCDPFTMLAYFRDAEAVITDTFHGTIFSIINEVPFATIIRKSSNHGYGNEEKLGYLLDALGLSDRAFLPNGDLGELIRSPINFDQVRSIREREQEHTRNYLAAALDSEEQRAPRED